MTRTGDLPADLVPIRLANGCLLLLTERGYVADLRRGKAWRWASVNARRGTAASTPDPTTPKTATFRP